MKYDFDLIVDRRNTYSIKYDPAARGKPSDVLPLWVADMDFQAPPCILEEMTKQVQHGIFGYSEINQSYLETLKNWFLRRFNWSVEEDWLVITPGIVTAIHVAIRALTEKSDGIIIQQPVYHPFASSVQLAGRRLVVNELVYQNGRYNIDFDDFERKIQGNNVKMFILCSPHNPVGRVWTQEELVCLADICLQHGVIIISDEIHQDFVYDGHRHTVLAGLTPAYRDSVITCTAASKSFNLAGLQLSNIFIANPDIKHRFMQEYARCGLSQPGVMGIVATKAAYEKGEEWLTQLIDYLSGNFSFLTQFIADRLPGIRLVEPEGTYLAWLDFRSLGLNDQQLNEIILDRARLWLNDGPTFGAGGQGFQRMNIACPRPTLRQALEQLERALKTATNHR